MDSPKPCQFTDLPLEIRQRVYELLFFGDQDQTDIGHESHHLFEIRKLKWALDGLARTARNQIHPYRVDSKSQPHYETAIFRTSHQIEVEATSVFYGWSSFNLTTDNFGPGEYKSYEFLQALPKRYRKLVRKIEHRCFDEYLPEHQRRSNRRVMPLFDWVVFMKFLANECPSLQSLILWGFADGREGESMVKSCHKDKEWAQAILQIKGLRFFNILAIPRGKIRQNQSCVPSFVEELRASLYQRKNVLSPSATPRITLDDAQPFPFLRLPLNVRKRVYRFALLPADKQLHPYIKSWYDGTTQNVVPLCLTCRQVREEAEMVLYGQGQFSSVVFRYNEKLMAVFNSVLPPRLLNYIRYVRVVSDGIAMREMSFLARYMKLDILYYQINEELTKYMNILWNVQRDNKWVDLHGCFNSVVVETQGPTELSPVARNSLEYGLRNLSL